MNSGSSHQNIQTEEKKIPQYYSQRVGEFDIPEQFSNLEDAVGSEAYPYLSELQYYLKTQLAEVEKAKDFLYEIGKEFNPFTIDISTGCLAIILKEDEIQNLRETGDIEKYTSLKRFL